MRSGYYSDKYFVRSREVLLHHCMDPVVTMQVFQKNDAFVAGTDEAIGILKLCLTEGYSFSDLDAEGFRHVKIAVSGGFSVDKIRYFEASGVPVDSYSVGSAVVRGSFDYTADVVRVGGEPLTKVGRWHRENECLERVA
jgi:nicotinic acid phosphoribosyltransferase